MGPEPGLVWSSPGIARRRVGGAEGVREATGQRSADSPAGGAGERGCTMTETLVTERRQWTLEQQGLGASTRFQSKIQV